VAMRQWIAIGAAVGLVAVSIPYLRSQDGKISDILAKARSTAPGGAKVMRVVTPPPLTNIDLTRIDDRGGTAIAPAHGDRKAALTLNTKYQRAAHTFLRAGQVPRSPRGRS
jgi:penicillin-binding protein A